MTRWTNPGVRTLLLLAMLAGAPGCLVLSLNPAYDDESLGWDARLLGSWVDEEDTASMEIERDEWKSYRIRFAHPAETAELTAHLTIVNEDRFLDVMPVRGQDRGSVLIPVHLILRVQLDGDRLELTPLSYDWFLDRLRSGRPVPGLQVVLDQKENALIVSPVAKLRAWLGAQPRAGAMFGASAVFTRK